MTSRQFRLALLLLVLGSLLIAPALVVDFSMVGAQFWGAYALYTLSFLICAYLFLARQVAWYGLFIVIFLFGGYFKSMIAFWSIASSNDILSRINPEWEMVDVIMVQYAFFVSALAFLLSVVTYAALISIGAKHLRIPHVAYNKKRIQFVALVLLAMAVVLSIVRGVLGVGVMGLPTDSNIMYTLLFRVQQYALPAVFIGLLWAAKHSDAHRSYKLIIAAMLANFILVSIVSASKSGVINFVIIMVFGSAYFLEIKKKHAGWWFFGAFVGLAFFVFMANLRVGRQGGAGLFESMHSVLNSNTEWFSDEAFAFYLQLPMRVIGVDGLWMLDAAGKMRQQLAVGQIFSMDNEIIEYFTRIIVGVSDPNDFRSPGFVATLYMFGGWLGVIFGVPLVVFLLNGWISAFKKKHYYFPISVYTMFFAFMFLVDGAFNIKDLLAFVVACVSMVVVLAYVVRHKRIDVSKDMLPAAG